MKISPKDSEEDTFPSATYLLAMNPAAFFSVIFVDTSLYQPADPITIEYTWYGQNGYTITGEWVDLYFNLTLDDTKSGETTELQVPVNAFVSYMASPEPGL